MAKSELKVELSDRYCPTCHIDTQHAVLYQTRLGRRGRVESQEELSSGCAICNSDRFWGLKLATQYDQEKFLAERWISKNL